MVVGAHQLRRKQRMHVCLVSSVSVGLHHHFAWTTTQDRLHTHALTLAHTHTHARTQVKNLMLPWQWGLKHFWDAQMDADLECDALGWQYVSGGMTGGFPNVELVTSNLNSKSSKL